MLEEFGGLIEAEVLDNKIEDSKREPFRSRGWGEHCWARIFALCGKYNLQRLQRLAQGSRLVGLSCDGGPFNPSVNWHRAFHGPSGPEEGLLVPGREVGLTETSATAFPERISARTEFIEVHKILWSFWLGVDDTTSADVIKVAKTVGEARPPGIEKQSVTTASDIALSSDEARPPGIEKQSTTIKPELAQSSAGESSRVNEGNSGLPSGCGVRRKSCEPKKLWAAREARIGRWRGWR